MCVINDGDKTLDTISSDIEQQPRVGRSVDPDVNDIYYLRLFHSLLNQYTSAHLGYCFDSGSYIGIRR